MNPLRQLLSRLLPATIWRTRFGALLAATFATIIAFDVLWCIGTTFRAMSDAALYINALLATLIILGAYVATRRLWVMGLTLLILDGILVANLMYCRTYFTAIPLESYLLAGNLADFTASVTDSMRWGDLALPIITIASLLWARRLKAPAFDRHFYLYWLALTLLAGVGAWTAATLRGGFTRHYAKLHESCYYTTCTTPIYTVAGTLAYEALNGAPRTLDAEGDAHIAHWLADKERLRPHTALPDSLGASNVDNIVLILCESLESWVIGRDIEGTRLTPVLDSLIADTTRTLYFPNVLTQVGPGRSIDAQLLINAGMLPMQSGVYSMSRPDNIYYTINQALTEKNGARSYLLTGDKPIVWNQEPIARSFGIDTLLTKDSWTIDERVGNPPKLSDGSLMRQTVEKMRSGQVWPIGEKAFVQIVTYSGHNPFRLPEPLQTVQFSDRYPERVRDYMMMAHYTDSALGTLLRYLSTRPDYDRTLIVITGDHEGLAMERPLLRRNPAARQVVSPGQFTPLIVLNSPVAGTRQQVIGQADIYPTLLNLAGLDAYRWHGVGTSALSPHHPAYARSTMTASIVGDTIGADPALLRNIVDSHTVSDIIISANALPRAANR